MIDWKSVGFYTYEFHWKPNRDAWSEIADRKAMAFLIETLLYNLFLVDSVFFIDDWLEYRRFLYLGFSPMKRRKATLSYRWGIPLNTGSKPFFTIGFSLTVFSYSWLTEFCLIFHYGIFVSNYTDTALSKAGIYRKIMVSPLPAIPTFTIRFWLTVFF